MRLFKISQTVADGYDTYSDAIVVAADAAAAVLIHPASNRHGDPVVVAWDPTYKDYGDDDDRVPGHWVENDKGTLMVMSRDWAPTPAEVTAVEVGTAAPSLAAGLVLCASFHAG